MKIQIKLLWEDNNGEEQEWSAEVLSFESAAEQLGRMERGLNELEAKADAMIPENE